MPPDCKPGSHHWHGLLSKSQRMSKLSRALQRQHRGFAICVASWHRRIKGAACVGFLEECRVLGMTFNRLQPKGPPGFTVLEALFASAILALGLSGAVQLSRASMAANQTQQSLDLASGLAQDLAECWQVPSAFCNTQFQSSNNASVLTNEAGIQFQRSWKITALSTQGANPNLLQSLQISVKWSSPDLPNSTHELNWQIRRAATPAWVGL